MFASTASLAECLSAVAQSWRRQGIACPPADLGHVRRIVAANGVWLPPDFEQLYCTANGTPELYPNDLDEFGCSFLPVEYLRATKQEWLVITSETAMRQRVQAVPFVDYMHFSWEYGFMALASEPGYQIGIMAGNGEFKVLTTSLAEFLGWYLADADELYDWGHPYSVLGRRGQPL